MKNLQSLKSALLSAFVLLSIYASAQAPKAFSYQSVIRDGSGELVANQQVGIQISILQGSASGTAVYTETHTPTTNANGLASLDIGEGTPSTGVFGSINWGNGPYFVETSTDPAGGTNYSISSVSQLLSVPYANYSAVADSLSGGQDYVSGGSKKIMISGSVDRFGNECGGTEGLWSVQYLGGGQYDVTFTEPFTVAPVITATPAHVVCESGPISLEIGVLPSTNFFRVYTRNSSGSPSQSSFNFIVIGQQ